MVKVVERLKRYSDQYGFDILAIPAVKMWLPTCWCMLFRKNCATQKINAIRKTEQTSCIKEKTGIALELHSMSLSTPVMRSQHFSFLKVNSNMLSQPIFNFFFCCIEIILWQYHTNKAETLVSQQFENSLFTQSPTKIGISVIWDFDTTRRTHVTF